jgi:hypothetical protein
MFVWVRLILQNEDERKQIPPRFITFEKQGKGEWMINSGETHFVETFKFVLNYDERSSSSDF